MDPELSEELDVKVGMHQGYVLSPFLFAVVVDAVTELTRESAFRDLLYADDLVLKSETIKGLRNKLIKWKEAFKSKGLKVNLGKSKVMATVPLQKMASLKAKLTHVWSAAGE